MPVATGINTCLNIQVFIPVKIARALSSFAQEVAAGSTFYHFFNTNSTQMGQTIVEVVKVVAPIALQALANAAQQLVDEAGLASASEATQLTVGDDPNSNGTIIETDTQQYCTDQFQANFGYTFAGLTSAPVNGQTPFAGGLDIIVWDPSKNEATDVQAYITNVFAGSVPAAETVPLANNLTALFKEKFTQIDLSWTPFFKRYNVTGATPCIVDVQMVTGAGYDENNNVMGVASYGYVAYPTASS